MIRLDLKREPHWLDLGHGVRLRVKPCTTALMMAARVETQRAPVGTHAGEEPGLRIQFTIVLRRGWSGGSSGTILRVFFGI